MAALAAASLYGASASGQTPPARPSLSVTFVSPGKTGEVFWDLFADNMRAAGRNLGIEVETLRAERSFRRMQDIGLAVVRREKKPDFLILVNEESAAVPVLEAADSAGIKTLLVSNALTIEDAARLGGPREKLANWIGSLVPDMETAGARMAQALIDAAREKKLYADDGKIHLLALGGDESTPASIARNNGLQLTLARNPDVVLDRFLMANWNETEAETLTFNFMQWSQRKRTAIAGIWAANDPMALGALKAAKRIGYAPGQDLFAVGLNWSPAALEKIEAGEILLSDGGHFLQGALSMLLVRDYADGCDFAQTSTTQVFRTSPVTRDQASAMRVFVAERRFEAVDFQKLRPQTKSACGHYDASASTVLKTLNSGIGD